MKRLCIKKLLSAFFIVALLVAATAFPVEAIGETADGFMYQILDGYVKINGYTGNAKNIEIPATIEGYPVTTLESSSFYERDGIETIIIPEGIKRINGEAFLNITSLKKISIPSTVTHIGDRAFLGCGSVESIKVAANNTVYQSKGNCLIKKDTKTLLFGCKNSVIPTDGSVTVIAKNAFSGCMGLIKITIPKCVTKIGDSAFAGCLSLKSVTLPEGLTSIGENAFENCSSLTKITIPSTVKKIGSRVVMGCDNLTVINVHEKNGVYRSAGNCLIEKKAKLLIAGCRSSVIPDDGSVKEINHGAFENCYYLKSITLPEGLSAIYDYAFSYCKNLESLYIPGSVGVIGEYAFNYCTNLKTVTIAEGLKRLPFGAFHNCSDLERINLPKSVTFVDGCAFHYCSRLKSVYVCVAKSSNHKISVVDYYNDDLLDADLYYHEYKAATCTKAKTCKICKGTVGTKLGHKYTNKCDTICNVCNAKRTITHTYDNKCDKSCNVCGKIRTVSAHRYTNKCDTTCNECNKKRTTRHNYKTTKNKATFKKSGSIVTKCVVCAKIKSKTTINKLQSVKLEKTVYSYDGKVKAPAVTVKDSRGKVLKKGTDYTVTYDSGRKNVGTYNVKITFIGNYSGTRLLTFKIFPNKTYLVGLAQGVKSMAVEWAPKSEQVTGYQFQYSTAKDFSNAKTVTVSDKKKTSHTVKNLASNKTYYVRIRTYKVVNKVKVFSGWSDVKSVKTK